MKSRNKLCRWNEKLEERVNRGGLNRNIGIAGSDDNQSSLTPLIFNPIDIYKVDRIGWANAV